MVLRSVSRLCFHGDFLVGYFNMEKIMNQKKSVFQNPWVLMVTALFCCALWGSATPFIKIGYELILPPDRSVSSVILFAGIRFSLAGVLTILVGSFLQKKFLVPKKSSFSKVTEDRPNIFNNFSILKRLRK